MVHLEAQRNHRPQRDGSSRCDEVAGATAGSLVWMIVPVYSPLVLVRLPCVTAVGAHV